MNSSTSVVLTGGTSGFGFALAQELHKMGWSITNVCRTRSNSSIFAREIVLDLGCCKSSDVHLQGVECDVLINNAAVYLDDDRNSADPDTSISALSTTINVNLIAPVWLSMHCARSMIKKRAGVIVNISSGMGRLNEMAMDSLYYRLSKYSINGLTIAVANMFAGAEDAKLSCFSYCPGWINTKMGKGGQEPTEPAKALASILYDHDHSKYNGGFWRGDMPLSFVHKEPLRPWQE